MIISYTCFFRYIIPQIGLHLPQGDALYKKSRFFSNNQIKYYKIKSNFQLTKVYLFFNFVKDFRKIIYLIKKQIKNTINS